jgi:hypothetical protein
VIVYLVLGLGLLLALILLGNWFSRASPATLAWGARWLGVAALGGVGLYLLATGRLMQAVMTASAIAPLFVRWKSLFQGLRNARGPTPGRSSVVETRFLRMTLDHDSGVMSGTVLDGPERGRTLDELPVERLLDLLARCRTEDPQSVALLEAYLDRMRGPEWRQDWTGGAAQAHGSASAGTGGMTREEAYAVLGLEPGAGPEAIREAHRRLMLANHPDRGGSTYIAAQINRAKDLLLGE